MKTRRPGPSGETNETPRHGALATGSRAAILRVVGTADTGLTADDVVAQVGLHPSTVRAHLDHLVDAGLLVKARASDGSPGRPAWRYRAAAPGPTPGLYRTLAAASLEHLGRAGETAAVTAGRAWGTRLAASVGRADPVEATISVLRRLGFEPSRRTSAGTRGSAQPEAIHLHACPFLDLVGREPDVMCALHAGMIRGVVQAAGAPDAQVALEPFAAPTACVVRLRVPRSPLAAQETPRRNIASRAASHPRTGERAAAGAGGRR